MSFLEDLAVHLNSLSVGVYPGTSVTRTIYIGQSPDTPDALVCLYGRPGKPKELYTDIQYPELHVEVRAATYGAAQTKAEAIDTALHGLHDTPLSGHKFLVIQALGVPARLTTDARNRTIFYQNFLCTKGL